MKFLLDTNICIFLGRHTYPQLNLEIASQRPEDLAISAVSAGELAYGKALGNSPRSVQLLAANLEVLPFDAAAAETFGAVRANLEARGLVIGPYDLQIAAHALSLGRTLVSNNMRELSRVRGLKVVDWTTGD